MSVPAQTATAQHAPAESADPTATPKSVERILSGQLWAEVLRFGVPLAIGMGLQTTFNLVDAYIIAQLEGPVAEASLAAIANCDNLAAVGMILSYGLSIATGTIVSRQHGAGDNRGLRKVAWQSLLLLLFLSVGFGIVGLGGATFVIEDLMHAKGPVARLSIPYLRVALSGSGAIFLLLHLVTLQRAMGSSKVSIALLIVANVLNLVLAVLLVYGPGPAPAMFSWGPTLARALSIPRMELTGAAWATLLARLVALVPAFVVVVYRHRLFRSDARESPKRATMLQIWRLGWPTSSQLVLRILAILAVIAFTQHAFTTAQDQSASTALGVVLRWETMALFVGLGWGSASQTFMGQNLGAGQLLRARQSGWYGAFYNALMMLFFALSCLLWGRPMLSFFSTDAEVIAIGESYFRWVAPSYLGLGMGVVLGSAIQGAGATRQTFVLDLMVILGLQIPMCWLAAHFGSSVTQLWQVVAATNVAFAIVYTLSYRRGRFLHANVA